MELFIWLYLGSVLSGFGVGFVISQIDVMIPVLVGRHWKAKDAMWRQSLAVIGFICVAIIFIWYTGNSSFLRSQISISTIDLMMVATSLVLSSYFGIMYGNYQLKNAPNIISQIINAMFPTGTEIIKLGAIDVNAATKILQFLDQVGGPYRDSLFFIANGINSPILSWYLIGAFTKFTDLSEEEQKIFVKKWMKNDTLTLRSLGDAFKAMGALGYYTDPRIWKEIGFPGPFVPEFPSVETHTHDVPLHVTHTNMPGDKLHPFPPNIDIVEKNAITDKNIKIFGITRFQNRSTNYGIIDSSVKIKTDVCIIGSGAGGGVLAYELAKNPEIQRIVILERGSFNEGEDFNQRELDMISRLWKGGGFTFNQDYSIFIGQGQTLGGTTVINHAICINTPPIVLQEWAKMNVSEYITDAKNFQKSLDEVKKEIHVNPVPELEINKNNKILKDGAQKLKIPSSGHGPNPRNCFDCCECGFSHLGCHYNAKQSTLVTYIPKALQTGKCVVICDCYAETITYDGKIATGVDAVLMTSDGDEKFKIRIDASVVIASAGAINSSALLLRSKTLDPNKQIGKGLAIHPSPLVMAEFPYEVRAYQGIPMSYHVSEYSAMNGVPGIMPNDPPIITDLPQDQRGGFALESVFPNPGQLGGFLPGIAEYHMSMMKKINYYGAAGILIRDTPKGVISINWSGEPIINYALDIHDKKNLSNGIRKAAEIFFAEGAVRVIITHRMGNIITCEEYARDPNILNKRISIDNCGQDQLIIGAVHPQGGNRMGDDPTLAVVDSHCRHHQIKNLFVCDASVFPTATGVNPMLTIMGIAKKTAEYIKVNWKEIHSIRKINFDPEKSRFETLS